MESVDGKEREALFDEVPAARGREDAVGEEHRPLSRELGLDRSMMYIWKRKQADEFFQFVLAQVADRVGDAHFSQLPMVGRLDYGWMKFVNHEPCPTVRELSLFYRRIGYVLSVLVALRSGDHHCDNLVASSSNPVLVDLECSFIPSLIFDRMASPRMSMKSVGVISHLDRIGEIVLDIGALARTHGSTHLELVYLGWGNGVPELGYKERRVSSSPNSAHKCGSLLRSQHFRKYLIAGYKEGRDVLRRMSATLRASLLGMHDKPMRVVIRNTRYYQELLALSLVPEACRNTETRRATLERFLQVDDRRLRPIVAQEIRCLLDGDIPHFTHFPGESFLCLGQRRFGGIITKSGLDLVLRDLPQSCELRSIGRRRIPTGVDSFNDRGARAWGLRDLTTSMIR